MKRRVVAVVAACALTASAAVGVAGVSAAPNNFGQCAAAEARFFPPGPAHGQSLRLAAEYNPSGEDIRCEGPNPHLGS